MIMITLTFASVLPVNFFIVFCRLLSTGFRIRHLHLLVCHQNDPGWKAPVLCLERERVSVRVHSVFENYKYLIGTFETIQLFSNKWLLFSLFKSFFFSNSFYRCFGSEVWVTSFLRFVYTIRSYSDLKVSILPLISNFTSISETLWDASLEHQLQLISPSLFWSLIFPRMFDRIAKSTRYQVLSFFN